MGAWDPPFAAWGLQNAHAAKDKIAGGFAGRNVARLRKALKVKISA
jgi:hypothetical protein